MLGPELVDVTDDAVPPALAELTAIAVDPPAPVVPSGSAFSTTTEQPAASTRRGSAVRSAIPPFAGGPADVAPPSMRPILPA